MDGLWMTPFLWCLGLTIPAQIGQVDPPPAISTEGVPPISKALERSLAPYRTVPGFGFGGWLGDRRELLIRAGAAPSGQVFSVVTPGAAPRQLSRLSARLLGVEPRPGRNQFVLLYDTEGNESVQLALSDTRTGLRGRLTDGHSHHADPRWSRDGQTLALTSDARNGRDFDVYLIRPDDPDPSPSLLAKAEGLVTVEDWSPDDRALLVVEVNAGQNVRVRTIDVETGASTVLVPGPGTSGVHSPASPRWSADGQSIFLTLYDGGEFRRLARLDLASNRLTILSNTIETDVESFAVADDGKTLAVTVHDDGYSSLRILDAESGRELSRPDLPGGQIDSLSFRPGSTEVAFNLETTREPSQVYSVIVPTGVVVRWTRSLPGSTGVRLPDPPERIRYPSFDGREIPAFVYHPDPRRFPGPRPVLIDLHGGPQAQARPSFLGPDAYIVTELGIALVVPNVRGSSGYGISYLQLDDRDHREDAVRDVGALLDWIARQPEYDPNRLIVRGGSYGGYLVLASLARFGDQITAGINLAGISDFETFMADQPALRLELLRLEFGDERDPNTQTFFRTISPLRRADQITSPLLVVQGRNDPRVPVAEARQIVDAVRRNGVPVWYVLAENEGHGYSRAENLEYLRAVEATFLVEHLRKTRLPPDDAEPSAP
ncbi:S9 family peptidase [Tautonia marina]|uniref:S9 family peptidase n=1 Tax=Tautonia marina TaxID=2653855 RepID=UPI00126103BF|nr:prolyl oligopeptidase family serine peptidase [Tautonia marina]